MKRQRKAKLDEKKMALHVGKNKKKVKELNNKAYIIIRVWSIWDY